MPPRAGGGRHFGRNAFAAEDGFTLIEVVAALAILGLLLALALPPMAIGTSRPKMEALAVRVASLLDGDRRSAMLSHRVVASSVDMSRRLLRSGSGGAAVVIPDDVALSSTLARSCLGAANGDRIVFLPTGMSCGGSVTLAAAGRAIDVKVNWLTGSSTIASR